MDSRDLEISVVVISWNQRELLCRLIQQLLDQDFPEDKYEIVVVDDGSTDGSREWLRANTSPRLRVEFGNSDRGRAASRNAGIRAAAGRIIVMIDGDHTVSRNFLSAHADRHCREICAIVGKSDFVDHPDFRALNSYLNNSGAAKLPASAQLPGRYFLTRNCSVPRDVLLRIGLFDESFTAWGGEDLELGVRIAKAGVPIYGDSRSLAIHHHLRPLPDLLQQVQQYGRECVPRLIDRHPELLRELNLHRVVPMRNAGHIYQTIRQAIHAVLLSGFVWRLALLLAQLGRRRHLPRLLFDYLHFRQYATGYLDYLKTQGGKSL